MLKYFAYGSNMSLPRLQARINDVDVIGVHRLDQYRMAFNLSGSDGSAKCNIVPCNHGSCVWGVLFSIPPTEQSKLDAFESLGQFYDRVSISVLDDLGAPVDAFTYVGLNSALELLPFDWYRHHVYTGALQAGIPADYLQQIETVSVQDDLDSARRDRELSIYLA